MENENVSDNPDDPEESGLRLGISRSEFLLDLKKWLIAVVGIAVCTAVLFPNAAADGSVKSSESQANGGGAGLYPNNRGASRENGGGEVSWVNRQGW